MNTFTYTRPNTEIIFKATTEERLLDAVADFRVINNADGNHSDFLKEVQNVPARCSNDRIYFVVNEGTQLISLVVEDNTMYFTKINEPLIINRVLKVSSYYNHIKEVA